MPREVTWHLLSHPGRAFQGSNLITSQFPYAPSLGAGHPQRALGPCGEVFFSIHPAQPGCIPPVAIPSVLRVVSVSRGRMLGGTG